MLLTGDHLVRKPSELWWLQLVCFLLIDSRFAMGFLRERKKKGFARFERKLESG
jgi:hypothetical protein